MQVELNRGQVSVSQGSLSSKKDEICQKTFRENYLLF